MTSSDKRRWREITRKAEAMRPQAAAEKEGYRSHQQRTMEAREAAGSGVSREQLRAEGYRSVGKHSDLLAYGYQIIVWFSPRIRKETGDYAVVYEYAPYEYKQTKNLDAELRRMTATTIEEQQAVHAAIGVRDSDVCDTQEELF